NLGFLLYDRGEYGQALPHLERALAMRQRLYPEAKYLEGHPDLAQSLSNLGFLLHATGEHARALPYLERALAAARKHAAREIAAAPEAQALAYLQSLSPTRDGYLSAAVRRPLTGAASYRQVWTAKAALLRLQRRRHEAALIARTRSADARDKHDRL